MIPLSPTQTRENSTGLTVFLGGDTMTGRGVDQILPHPSAPELHEGWVKDANEYVALAEAQHGPIERPVPFDYVWGDGLAELDRIRPAARIINLETSITRSGDYQIGKGIHYRMHPENTPCLTAAGIDCCVLANNHVLDWGTGGLRETLATLARAGIRPAGAGIDRDSAIRPARILLPTGQRVLVFAYGLRSSGIPPDWAAAPGQPGINLLDDLAPRQATRIAAAIHAEKRPGDVVVVSVHWGPNWGYAIQDDEIDFAHRMIDEAGASIVHGHSSHHAKAIEVYRDQPIIYGCGDLLNDYEGITGHETFRGDLALMSFPTLDAATGQLVDFRISVMQIKRFRLNRPSNTDARWMADRLAREGRRFGTRVLRTGHQLTLAWD